MPFGEFKLVQMKDISTRRHYNMLLKLLLIMVIAHSHCRLLSTHIGITVEDKISETLLTTI